MKQLILASQSPRRKDLLTQLGYQFTAQSPDIDETLADNESAKHYVLRLAQQKAQTIYSTLTPSQQAQAVVLGSDTSVVIAGEVLGKPQNEADCIQMLMRLENKQHQVLTAIAAINQNKAGNTKIVSRLIETQVKFKPLTLDEIKRYWQTKEPCDKAGSYAIQGIGGQFVINIKGSYSAVVGLPLYETAQLLTQLGLPTSINQISHKD